MLKPKSFLEQLKEGLAKIDPKERESLGRAMRQEDIDDPIRRGDVYDILRKLRTQPTVPSSEFQRALSVIMGEVRKLERIKDDRERDLGKH